MILLISVSQVARITGVSHQCPTHLGLVVLAYNSSTVKTARLYLKNKIQAKGLGVWLK
jgi:hypothetical protein